MKVAVTSQNFRTVTQHAGKARRFLVFEVQPGEVPVEIERIDLPKEMSFHAYHGEMLHPVQAAGVECLVTGGCGNGFRARMARLGIGLLVTEESDPARAAAQAACLPINPALAGAGEGSHKSGHHHANAPARTDCTCRR